MNELTLVNATVVTPEAVLKNAYVHVLDGLIDDVGQGTNIASGLDCDSDFVIPGIVDLNTDNLEMHVAPRSNVRWPMLAALLMHDTELIGAGITTTCDGIAVGESRYDKPQRDVRREMLDEAIGMIGEGSRSSLTRAEHFIHLRFDISNERIVEMFERYIGTARTRVVSLLDRRPQSDEIRATSAGTLEAGRRNEARRTIAAGCRARKIPVLSHDDRSPDQARFNASIGVAVAEFPLNEDALSEAHACGMKVAMGAPNVVRGGSQYSGNPSATQLEERGLLDLLCSDYVPFSLLQAAFLLHFEHAVALERAMHLVSGAPAAIAGFEDRGAIAVGKRADLVRVHAHGVQPVVRVVWREGRRVA
jgi:alpha-D-ribose 1-methylphosphonate 5-triphosphate diphosphatase